jgi:hypothetical protein
MSEATLESILGDPVVPDSDRSRPPAGKSTAEFETADWHGEAERRLAALCASRHAVLTASGSQAVEVQLQLHEIGAGDEVLIPPGAWHNGTPGLVVERGALPVFFDAEPGSWCGDPDQIEPHITEQTRALYFAPLYGGLPDLPRYAALAERHKLVLLGNLDHGLEVRYRGGRPLMRWSADSVAALGDGAGVLVTDDAAAAAAARAITGHGDGARAVDAAAVAAAVARAGAPREELTRTWKQVDRVMAFSGWEPQRREPGGPRWMAGYRCRPRNHRRIPVSLEREALGHLTRGAFAPLHPDPWRSRDAAVLKATRRGVPVWTDLCGTAGAWSGEFLRDERAPVYIEAAFRVIDSKLALLSRYARDGRR